MNGAHAVASPRVVCIDDFRPIARRRIPRAVFDYLDGGHPIADFLEDFPTVSEMQVHQLLAEARARILAVAED